MRTLALSTAALMLLAPATFAQVEGQSTDEDFLTIGDKAPALDVEHWVKNVKVDSEGKVITPDLNDGNVHVVEFWATWCGPCIAGMPHLSELQEKYADYNVQVIGISDEPLHVVSEFLFKKDRQSNKMHWERTNYTLATDPDESVWKDWFRAAGQNGIPCAFIVGKEGEIEWIGHPMGMDDPLDKIVRGEWDRTTFAAEWEKSEAESRAQMKTQREMMAAREAGNWDKYFTMLDEQAKENPQMASFVEMEKFFTLIGPANRADEGYKLGDKIVKNNWDDPMMLNQIAWFTITRPDVENPNYDFALKAAERASELTDNEDASILDTVARIYYDKGDLDKAIQWQEKAVEHNDGQNPEVDQALEKYRAEKNKKS